MKLVSVVYVGPYPEVEVPAAGIVAKHGEPVDVPEDVAKSLLTQTDSWAAPKAKPSAKAKE
jgi:hypothetical protein